MEHKALRQWWRAGPPPTWTLPVVAGAEVFRALLSLMRNDPGMADQVRAELEAHRRQPPPPLTSAQSSDTPRKNPATRRVGVRRGAWGVVSGGGGVTSWGVCR